MFWKSEPERGTDMQQASAHSAREGCSFLQVWLSPDSSIPSFWGTRRTLVLTKACREVSYWTQDCFLIPDTLTILVNRAPIQLPAWTFFFFAGFLLGLIFKVNAQMPRKAFFFSSCPPPSNSAAFCPCREHHAWSKSNSGTPPQPVSQEGMTLWGILPSSALPFSFINHELFAF